MYRHGLEVMSSNPIRIEVGVHCTYVLSCTCIQNVKISQLCSVSYQNTFVKIFLSAEEPKTVSHLTKASLIFSDDKQLAFAYTSLVNFLIDEIDENGEKVGYLVTKIQLYEVTGFPNFPLGM